MRSLLHLAIFTPVTLGYLLVTSPLSRYLLQLLHLLSGSLLTILHSYHAISYRLLIPITLSPVFTSHESRSHRLRPCSDICGFDRCYRPLRHTSSSVLAYTIMRFGMYMPSTASASAIIASTCVIIRFDTRQYQLRHAPLSLKHASSSSGAVISPRRSGRTIHFDNHEKIKALKRLKIKNKNHAAIHTMLKCLGLTSSSEETVSVSL